MATVLRPALDASMTAAEFGRWYWRLDELRAFARALGLRAAGSKQVVTDRIAAALAGAAFAEPEPVRRAGRQLVPPLSEGTVVPADQRCSEVLRSWLVDRIGPSFRFDQAMREFFTDGDGSRTLGDAVEHWYATRDETPRPIAGQFEYNRFVRSWHEHHPDGTRAEVLAAWHSHRSQPADERPLV